MAERTEHPPVTVYVSARVYDPDRTVREKRGKKRRKSGGMRHVWSIKLERWTPEEVERYIIELFTRLAADESAALEETREGLRAGRGQ